MGFVLDFNFVNAKTQMQKLQKKQLKADDYD